jgi:Ca2+-binding RTX toxin-like protein
MQLPTLTRRRSALLAALPAVLAAIALPAAAQAASVELGADNTLKYRAAGGETNAVVVTDVTGGVEVQDQAGLTSRTRFCAQVSSVKVRCAIGFRLTQTFLGDRNDSVSVRVPNFVLVDGGPGDDTFFAGMAPSASRVEYRGNHGTDTLTYASASAGAVMLQDEQANDGRPARSDRDNVRRDIERFVGSAFSDRLEGSRTGLVLCIGCSGSSHIQRFVGGLGDDTLRGGGNMDQHFMGGSDGADTVLAGPNFTVVDYSGLSRPVAVTVGHGQARDDGPAGDRDEIGNGVETLIGGRGDDTLTHSPFVESRIAIFGGPGTDTLTGGRVGDSLQGDGGTDTLLGMNGDDSLYAQDGERDVVACGIGTDTATLDSIDGQSSCETRRVGVLRLAPRAVVAEAAKTARLRLSWRHPVSWRKLAKIELRLSHDAFPVGTITIRPRTGRIAAGGAVRLVRRHSRIIRKGELVAARLALRVDASLAGQTLNTEVEATDTRGRRQIERTR